MRIIGAEVFTNRLQFEPGEINIRDGLFTEEWQEDVVDATGLLAIPGLIDIHLHGAMNYDVCDNSEKAFQVIADYELSQGVTAMCPATLTLSVKELEEILRTGAAFAKSCHAGADLIGFNMEGPFISPARKGSQNGKYIIKADKAVAERFLAASEGLVKIIGLAPEEDSDFISYIASIRDRVIVSLAHTNADYNTARQAFEAGASHAVHLFNAMTGLQHRNPGVVGAVADCRWVNAEIICDGIHVHPAAVRAAFRLNGADRMVMISDSLRCTGMPDGEYQLGGQTVVKKGRACTLKENGSLAGSVSSLYECMVHAVKTMEIPLETAIACTTIHAARAIHCEQMYGSIESGKKGNVVLLRPEDLSIVAVIKDGRVTWRS